MRASLYILAFLLLGGLHAQGEGELDVALVDLPAITATEFYRSASLDWEQPTTQAIRFVGGFLVVTASVDGVAGNYVLDSGAPALIVNRPANDDDEVVAAESLNGAVAFARTTVTQFEWGPVRQDNLTAYAVDLEYLTTALGERIDGMIGYEQLRVTPVAIDYREASLTHLPQEGRVQPANAIRMRMRLSGHVPALRGRINNRRVRLALDTGAGVNLLDDERLVGLDEDVHDRMDDILLRGLDARQSRVPRARVHLTEIADANWIDLPFAFADLSGFAKAGLRVDGVLGKEWMQRHRVTLDYGRRRVWVE